MAFNSRKIFPLDTKPSVAIGVSVPYNGDAVFNSTFLTKDAIKANLFNFFLTNKKERFMNSRFGFNLRAFLFEQITSGNTEHLQQDIQSIISQRFKSVKLLDLEIDQNMDDNSLNIKIFYNIVNSDQTETLELTI
jgi:phage baseplate assembly protein W